MIRWVTARLTRNTVVVMLTLLLTIAGSSWGEGAMAAPSEPHQPSGTTQQDEHTTNHNAQNTPLTKAAPHPAQTPTFSNVSVHDPSIVKDGDTYYVFGSHIAAAKSTDLTHWTSFANGYTTPGNTLYGDLSENLAGSFAWAGENDSDSKGGFSVWAPDVFWNEDYINEDGSKGAYIIYYSASSTYIRSAIGMAVSQDIEGPYQYADTIVYSGFTRDSAFDRDSQVDKKWTNTHIQHLVEQGTLAGPRAEWFNADGSYGNRLFPNAIDPTVFYDTDGRLWMTYGSWSGGIFLLELNKATGAPIYPGQDGTTADGRMIDRYFGIKIAGGHGESGEGPYIEYNEDTGYFYLYVTYGGLASDGGYNMRTFRSTSPTGPYLDAKGQNAVLPEGARNIDYGNKLIGNFLFDSKIGDPGEGVGYGYVSPGHNSVYTNPDNGQVFLVFHTRFPQQGELHEVRVHQMFMNEDGWPVVAPYRYSGETLTPLADDALVGDYQFIAHGSDSSAEIKHVQSVRLNGDYTVTGDLQGTWQKTGVAQARLSLDNGVYDGVFLQQWDEVTEQEQIVFTVMSEQGEMLWGSQLTELPPTTVVDNVYRELTLGDTSKVKANLPLPSEGSRQSSITWATSDPSIVTASGEIARPEAGEQAVSATLTATITKGNIHRQKSFTVTVIPYEAAKLTAQYSFDGNLQDHTGSFVAGEVIGDRIDRAGGTITYTDGISGQAAVFDGASGVALPDGLLSGDSYSVALWVNPEELTMYTTTFFGAADANRWISLLPRGPEQNTTMLWSGSSPWYTGSTGLSIPTNEWTHLAFTVEEGVANVFVNGQLQFTGSGFPNHFTSQTGVFSLAVNWWDPPFHGSMDELNIFDGALSPAQVAELAQP